MSDSITVGVRKDQWVDGDELYFGSDKDYWFEYDNSQFEFWTADSDGSGTDGLLFTIDDGTDIVDFENDISFPNITGTPTFSDHDHSEGGLNTVPNSGLTNDTVTVADNSVALGSSTAVSIDNLSDVSSSTESAGHIPIWHGTNSQYENASLTGGNALSVTNADASVTIDVDTDGIQTDEIDLSITPTWTGQHTFNSGIVLAENTAIEDDTGTTRIRVDDSFTGIYGDGGTLKIEADEATGRGLRMSAHSGQEIAWQDISTAGNDRVLGYDPSDGFITVSPDGTHDLRLTSGISITYPDDSGAETLADMVVSGTPTAGTEESLSLAIDGSGLLKAYAEADGAGGLQNHRAEVLSGDLRIPTGSGLEDDSGTERFVISSATDTYMRDGNGQLGFATNTVANTAYARSGVPFRIQDQEASATAVQYDTDATAGVLSTPNAGISVRGNGVLSSGVGMDLRWTGSQSSIESYNRGTSSWENLQIRASDIDIRSESGLVDLSASASDLRLATGQAIEDGGGTVRIETDTNFTALRDGNGDLGFVADVNNSSYINVDSSSNSGRILRDAQGGFTAVKLLTSASAPSTLELTNADLDMSQHFILDSEGLEIGVQSSSDFAVASGNSVIFNSDGSAGVTGDDGDVIIGSEDSGGSGDKHDILFDYSSGSVSFRSAKQNIQPWQYDAEGILSLDAVTWDYKPRVGENSRAGFVSNDVAEVAPELIEWKEYENLPVQHRDVIDEEEAYSEGDMVPFDIDYDGLTAFNTRMIADIVEWAMENGYEPPTGTAS